MKLTDCKPGTRVVDRLGIGGTVICVRTDGQVLVCWDEFSWADPLFLMPENKP